MKSLQNATHFNSCAGKVTNCLMTWDAIEIEIKPITILGKPRRIQTVKAGENALKAARAPLRVPPSRRSDYLPMRARGNGHALKNPHGIAAVTSFESALSTPLESTAVTK
jgi:hypothetical protein